MDITVEQVIEQISAVTPGNVLLLASLVILSLGLIPTSASGEARRNLWGVLTLFSLGMAAAFALIQDPTAATSLDSTISLSLFAADEVTSRGVWLALLSVFAGTCRLGACQSEALVRVLRLVADDALRLDLYGRFARSDIAVPRSGIGQFATTVLLGITRSDDSGAKRR